MLANQIQGIALHDRVDRRAEENPQNMMEDQAKVVENRGEKEDDDALLDDSEEEPPMIDEDRLDDL